MIRPLSNPTFVAASTFLSDIDELGRPGRISSLKSSRASKLIIYADLDRQRMLKKCVETSQKKNKTKLECMQTAKI